MSDSQIKSRAEADIHFFAKFGKERYGGQRGHRQGDTRSPSGTSANSNTSSSSLMDIASDFAGLLCRDSECYC